MRNKFKKSYIVFVLLFSVVVSYSSLFYSTKNLDLSNSNQTYSHNSPNRPNLAINLDWNETLINTAEDAGRDIVMDVEGNIYLAGKEYNTSRGVFDIVIVKYNSSGNQEWKSTWNCSSDSIGYGIAMDTSQNLYITGYAKNTSTGHTNFMLKYRTYDKI